MTTASRRRRTHPPVLVPRALFEGLVAELAASFTKLGHAAQVVGHESMGLCSWRGCGATCTERRALLLAACDVLEAEVGRAELQPALFDAPPAEHAATGGREEVA